MDTTIERLRMLASVIRAAEMRWGLVKGELCSDRKRGQLGQIRQIVALIGRDELRLSHKEVAEVMNRDRSGALRLAAAGRNLICMSEWAEAYTDLIRRTDLRRRLAALKARQRARESGANVSTDDIWPSKGWWIKNNQRFVAAMRTAHPDREIALREVRS